MSVSASVLESQKLPVQHWQAEMLAILTPVLVIILGNSLVGVVKKLLPVLGFTGVALRHASTSSGRKSVSQCLQSRASDLCRLVLSLLKFQFRGQNLCQGSHNFVGWACRALLHYPSYSFCFPSFLPSFLRHHSINNLHLLVWRGVSLFAFCICCPCFVVHLDLQQIHLLVRKRLRLVKTNFRLSEIGTKTQTNARKRRQTREQT